MFSCSQVEGGYSQVTIKNIKSKVVFTTEKLAFVSINSNGSLPQGKYGTYNRREISQFMTNKIIIKVCVNL